MSVQKVYTCDCCGFLSPKAVEFNNGPLNSLVFDWGADNKHYCNVCIVRFNSAIKKVFSEAKNDKHS